MRARAYCAHPNIRDHWALRNHVEQSELELSVGYFTLFKYSSCWDKILMLTGSLMAIGSGMIWPCIIILYGNFVDQFVHNANSNSTNGSNTSILDSDDFLLQTAELSLYYAAVGLIILLCQYVIVCSFSLAAANQVHKIRCLFMASILKQDIGWFDTHETGDFASRLTSDLNKIEDGIGDKIGICFNFLSTTLICLGVGLYYGWKLALVTLSVTPIMTVSVALISRVQSSVANEESKAYGAAGAAAEEALSSIRTVVAFGGELKEIERL
ncbi:ATP-dependent translocase ABCB1 [Trichonephila clavipes]|nr:ATP-dependent translocase ABCB1 [Trichonephila clavipes]